MNASNDGKSGAIAIIGPGRVGTTIARVAQDNGYRVTAMAGRGSIKLAALAPEMPDTKICSIVEAPDGADLVFLTVSDDAIEKVCQELAQQKAFTEGQIVVHCSGALTSDVLKSAREMCGARIVSAHPLQSFSTSESAVSKMRGTYWFCEGDADARVVVSQFIKSTGGIPNEIAADKKVLYHCSSVVASNYLVSVLDAALKSAELAGLERHLAWQALKPIVTATVDNVDKLDTVDALTGPIARGDVNTVRKHLSALDEKDQELAALYRAMGEWTVGLATRKGLSKAAADSIRESLKK